ncbi:MAG: ATP-binding cassette domain-containing protein, partial [Candidatus Methanomethylophilaceae archaeon]|nr:ATP-binding cassette domain-containing protein [Candidatus Methanomethylophilaceae archaeon]
APATSGKVEVKIGDTWVNMSDAGEGGRGRATPYIGVLHQEYALYPSETILQNLTSCIGLKMPAELAKVKAIRSLLSVGFPKEGMEKLLNALPGDLSVGEVQRVAFALVLIKEPKVVVLDEPTGTMDPITKVAVAQAVIKAREDLNETFIVVSHDMDFILNCCDRVALMKDGKITSIGPAEPQVKALRDLEKEIIEAGGEL